MPNTLTRRTLIQAAGIAGALSTDAQAQQKAEVEPITVKRRGVGYHGHDPARASPGFTLFAPTGETNKSVYLIDLSGKVVHTWSMPYPPGLYGYLTDRGTLFYNGKIPNSTHLGQSPFQGGVALEMDWKGRILWEVKDPEHHHDGLRLRNGNILLMCSTPLAPEIASKVRGGRARTEFEGKMNGDYLVELTIKGELVWKWQTWDHLDPADYPITALQDTREEWTHANGISEMPDGNILLSFRNVSSVVMVNRKTGSVYWKLGAPPLSGQHAPYLLPNGHILLFDNGPHRLDESFPFSRVLEIDPATKNIVWKFQESIPANFFSPRVSNARRLPNGNTLINEGMFGRFFEVTSEGEVVWEYVNPYFGGPAKAQTNQVFRAYRYTPEEIARAQETA